MKSSAPRTGSAKARRLAGVGTGVLLIALATGARSPSTGSLEAFVKPSVPLRISALPDVVSGAVPDVTRPTAMSPGQQTPAVGALDWSEIPAPALRAYQRAALIMERSAPGCGLTWEMLAGIGRVESDHGRFGGGTVNADGSTTPGIYGVALNGVGNVTAISDTENGTLDGDSTWDRAVGPMQFLPTTWDVVGVDADADGVADPHDLDDAALAAGVYLCAGDVDLSDRAQLEQALWRYNPSAAYVALVLSYIDAYRRGEPAPPSTFDTPVDQVPTLDHLPDPQPHPTNHTTGPPNNNHPANDGPGTQPPNDNNGTNTPPNDPGNPGGPDPGGPGNDPPDDEPPDNEPPDDEPPDNDPPDDEPPDNEPPDDEPPDNEPPDDEPPEPEPGPVTLNATLSRDGSGAWFVGEDQVDFGDAEFTSQQASYNWDGDETTETLAEELEGLIGAMVKLDGERTETVVVAHSLNDQAWAPGEPTEPTPSEPSPTEPSESEPTG